MSAIRRAPIALVILAVLIATLACGQPSTPPPPTARPTDRPAPPQDAALNLCYDESMLPYLEWAEGFSEEVAGLADEASRTTSTAAFGRLADRAWDLTEESAGVAPPVLLTSFDYLMFDSIQKMALGLDAAASGDTYVAIDFLEDALASIETSSAELDQVVEECGW